MKLIQKKNKCKINDIYLNYVLLKFLFPYSLIQEARKNYF